MKNKRSKTAQKCEISVRNKVFTSIVGGCVPKSPLLSQYKILFQKSEKMESNHRHWPGQETTKRKVIESG